MGGDVEKTKFDKIAGEKRIRELEDLLKYSEKQIKKLSKNI